MGENCFYSKTDVIDCINYEIKPHYSQFTVASLKIQIQLRNSGVLVDDQIREDLDDDDDNKSFSICFSSNVHGARSRKSESHLTSDLC